MPDFTEQDCYSLAAHWPAIRRWIEIRTENGRPELPTDADFRKSCLLLRLLQGKEPLPVPPPRSNAAPWYSLVETGAGFPVDVWQRANDVIVNGGAGWTLTDSAVIDAGVHLEHPGAPGRWVLERTTWRGVASKGGVRVGDRFRDQEVIAVEPGEKVDRVVWSVWGLRRE